MVGFQSSFKSTIYIFINYFLTFYLTAGAIRRAWNSRSDDSPPLTTHSSIPALLITMSSAGGLPRRIIKETQRLIAEPVAGISATPYADNLRYFSVAIEGPSDSPYENGVFQLELFLPSDYPMAPPKVRFLTKIYHPNVDKLGRICLDILKDKWSPALQIRTVLLSIQALMSAPNPDDPLDNTVADVWKNDESKALETAREFTKNFAIRKEASS